MDPETVNETIKAPKICDVLDGFIRGIGHAVCWANGILVFVIILQVVLRYGFGRGLVLLEELQWHLYAVGIMIGASYALMVNSHIRVDIFHMRFSQRTQAFWEIFGIIVLLFPFVFIVFHQSLPFVYDSWRVAERSDAPMGLPFRWLIKGVIPFSFALLAIAALSRLIKMIASLKRG
jgi:TRAP-type mannitol/chloroaromatic compound transport system permease small subunit